MKKISFCFKILTPLFVLVVLCSAIYVPRYLLIQKYDTDSEQIHTAPESYYLASNTAMAKRASELLSAADKMKLITGVWDSEYQEIQVKDANLSETQAVEIAKNQLEYLYALNLYPDSVKSSYNNWYSWTSKVYSYSEQSFHTYTCNLWEITFEKYDKSIKHTILMTEDGIILLAAASRNERILAHINVKLSQDMVRVLLSDRGMRLIKKEKIEEMPMLTRRMKEIYPVPLDDAMQEPSITRATLSHFDDPTEDYIFYQFHSYNTYVVGVVHEETLSKK